MLRVQVTNQCTIKPSSPTPPHLRAHQLSWFDQHAYDGHFSFILFYSRTGGDRTMWLLKQSLSRALTIYYPLAGRMAADSLHVDCNDRGVDLLEAHCTAGLSQLLLPVRHPDLDSLRQLVPCDCSCSAGTGSLFVFKITTFTCGGVAVGLCVSHKVVDFYSASMFISAWAAVARGAAGDIPRPNFGAASLFPPSPGLFKSMHLNSRTHPVKNAATVTSRFVFSKSKIVAPKKTQSTLAVAAMALIWRCTMKAQGSACLAIVPVNFRKKLPEASTPSSDVLFGNLVTGTVTAWERGTRDDDERSRHEMEEKLTSDVGRVDLEYVRRVQAVGTHLAHVLLEEEGQPLVLLSWLGFASLEADFGWGKPDLVAPAGPFQASTVILLDRGRGSEGMEAWVTLGEEEMLKLQRDEELLSYATTPLFTSAL